MTEKWMRLAADEEAHAFLEIDLVAGFDRVEPAAGCGRFPVSKLVEDAEAMRCGGCVRTIRGLLLNGSSGSTHSGSWSDEVQRRLVSALGLLMLDQWEITSVPGMVTATRDWSDRSRDTVIMLSPDTAYARRDDPAGNLVWQVRGIAEEMAKAAQALAPPGSPGAPSASIGPV